MVTLPAPPTPPPPPTHIHTCTHTLLIRLRWMPHFTDSRASKRDAVIHAKMFKKKKKREVGGGETESGTNFELEFIPNPTLRSLTFWNILVVFIDWPRSPWSALRAEPQSFQFGEDSPSCHLSWFWAGTLDLACVMARNSTWEDDLKFQRFEKLRRGVFICESLCQLLLS